jgi:hypothetical protein
MIAILTIILQAGNGKGKYSVADIKTWPWVKG